MKTRLILACSAFVLLLALGVAARSSFGGDVQPSAVPSATIDSPDMAVPVDECAAPVDMQGVADEAAGYQCPDGVPYCQKASQCTDYCGGGFEACSQGCCACSG